MSRLMRNLSLSMILPNSFSLKGVVTENLLNVLCMSPPDITQSIDVST